MQSVAEGRDSSSSSLPSKPPKPGMHSLIPSSKKRESSGPNHMKPKKDNMEGANNLHQEIFSFALEFFPL